VAVTQGTEPVPQPAERTDHLVGDEQDTVTVANLAYPVEVTGRRREAATRVLHRFEVDGGDRRRSLPHDRLFDLVSGPPPESHLVVGVDRRPVEVRVGDLDRT